MKRSHNFFSSRHHQLHPFHSVSPFDAIAAARRFPSASGMLPAPSFPFVFSSEQRTQTARTWWRWASYFINASKQWVAQVLIPSLSGNLRSDLHSILRPCPLTKLSAFGASVTMRAMMAQAQRCNAALSVYVSIAHSTVSCNDHHVCKHCHVVSRRLLAQLNHWINGNVP